MIIMISGIPCSGKTTLLKSIIKDLGSYENCEPISLFKCQKFKDVLVIGQYPENETFGGTDRLSYGTISKFQDFINTQSKQYKHIIFEGDRFTNNIEWILDKHQSMVYILVIHSDEENKRHTLRKDNQSETWLKGRRTQIDNIQKNLNLMGRLQIRDTSDGIVNVKGEIMEILNA